jgi:hypothetical protein
MTRPVGVTGVGVLLGTAAYMSPEQARGKAVDKRADIWAFGCVLFEMVTGRRAFQGEDATDTLAAVVRGAPPWSALPADTPEGTRRLLRRCLEKEPKERLRDIGDAALDLAEPDPSVRSAVATKSNGRAWMAVAVLLLALVAALWTGAACPSRRAVRGASTAGNSAPGCDIARRPSSRLRGPRRQRQVGAVGAIPECTECRDAAGNRRGDLAVLVTR